MRTSLLAVLILSVSGAAPSAVTAAPTLVELFTSEGCSSCPPADAYLHDLTTTAQARAGELIFIAWHVDYWDHLGWEDPYGLAFASKRQRDYASEMNRRSADGAGVYTPQMIVAGEHAFVGSDQRAGRAALRSAQHDDARPLDISVAVNGNEITLTAKLPKCPKGATVVGVLVEDGLTSAVTRGENAGRTLTHDRVARAVAAGEMIGETTTVRLTAPPGVVRTNASVVVFAQARDMGEILAVGAAPLAGDPMQQDRYQTLAVGNRDIRYALILPDNFDPARAYPAMLALPPGAQNKAMVEAGLGRYWEHAARERGWIVVSPINPDFAKLFQAPSDPLGALMDDISTRFTIEGGKFHLTGVSNGGRAAFLAALDNPNRFASLTVLPGLLAERTPTRQIKYLSDLPISMYVGGDDATWLREAQRSVADMKKQGISAILTVLDGERHVVSVTPKTLFDLLDSYRP